MITKINLTIVAILLTCSVFSQTLLMKNDIKTQRFGKEVFYKTNDNNLLDGHYKIADSRGNYSDIHFKKGKKHGAAIDYDYEGRKLVQRNFENGKQNGTYTSFFQNGKVRVKGEFVKGKQDGKWKYFDDKGVVKTLEIYKNGKKEGKWWKKITSQNQAVAVVTENYKNDQHFGHSEEKNEDGKLNWEREYVNNLSYTHKGYHPNGKIYIEKTLKDGKLDGKELKYNANGVLLTQKLYKEDQLQQLITYYENGNKKSLNNYAHGKRNGLFEEYTEKGIKYKSGDYKDDFKTGIWKIFAQNDGSLISETTYVNGIKNGITKIYNVANKVSSEGNFKNNEKDGIWKSYNLAGKLIKEIEYKLGREISSKEYK